MTRLDYSVLSEKCDEMEKQIEFLDGALKTAKGVATSLQDRVTILEKENNFYKDIIKYLIKE